MVDIYTSSTGGLVLVERGMVELYGVETGKCEFGM
jgi:hypothetical protein